VSTSATVAVRAWVNSRADLTDGQGNGPLAMGAFLQTQASPQGGAYAVLSAGQGGPSVVVAEGQGPRITRVAALVYAGTYEAAEAAAEAYARAVLSLSGAPVVMGGTGVVCLVSDNVEGPGFIPPAPDTGETFAFSVDADFVLYQGS
jgi:hypothetical protein